MNALVHEIDGGIVVPPLRFPKYDIFDEIDRKKWRKAMEKLVVIFKACTTDGKVDLQQYRILKRNIIKLVDGVGELKANHIIGMAGLLGVVNICYVDYIHGGAKSAYRNFELLFPMLPDYHTVMENFYNLLKTQAPDGVWVTLRYAENVICKVGRNMGNSDKFSDLRDPSFPYVRRCKGGLEYSKDGSVWNFLKGPIFQILLDGSFQCNLPLAINTSKWEKWMPQFTEEEAIKERRASQKKQRKTARHGSRNVKKRRGKEMA